MTIAYIANLGKVSDAVPLGATFVNSLVVAVSAVVLTGFLCSLGGFQIYSHLGWINTFLPLIVPGAASAFGIFTFMWSWNDYLWPLLVLHDPQKYTVPVALGQLKGTYGNIDDSVVTAGTLVGAIPLIVLFLFIRKWIFRNMVAGAVK